MQCVRMRPLLRAALFSTAPKALAVADRTNFFHVRASRLSGCKRKFIYSILRAQYVIYYKYGVMETFTFDNDLFSRLSFFLEIQYVFFAVYPSFAMRDK